MDRTLAALLVLGVIGGVGANGPALQAPASISQSTAHVARGSDEPVDLVYVWSTAMPLSRLGIAEIRRAAEAAGVGLIIRTAAELDGAARSPEGDRFARSLVAAGAAVHYPSLVILRSGRPLGTAFVGYKRADAYLTLVRDRLAPPGVDRRVAPSEDLAAPPRRSDLRLAPSPEGETAIQDVRVLWSLDLRPAPGAFFRHVPGTNSIAYEQDGRIFLRDLATERSFRAPGWIDFVPSPDGELFVTPRRSRGGLEFYLASEVLERGAVGRGDDVDPFFIDRTMRDQYPSVGVLDTDGEGRATRYRVLVSWFSGVVFRDYEARWDGSRLVDLGPAAARREGCPGMNLSTPILSEDGRELAARDESTGTTKVFALEDDGGCDEVVDLGRATSKVGFSDDGNLIAYSAQAPAASGSGFGSITYVYDRAGRRTRAIPSSASGELVIPEVIGTDSLLIAVREEPGGRTAQFRLLCCLR